MSLSTENASLDYEAHATYLGYRNGDQGPRFPVRERNKIDMAAWPSWSFRIKSPESASRIEGGLRVDGQLKSGCEKQPLVSYVTVVRNNERTLERTIKSVQSQDYDNVEHIILDGASTDGTLGIIQRYADVIDYFISEPDAGLYDALNKAIPLARGQLICVLNSDDWLECDAARIAVSHLRDTDSAVLILTAARVADNEGAIHEWPPAFVHPGSYFTCANDCHNAIYASRRSYELSGPYDHTYKIAADFKWIMSCLDAGSTFIYTAESTVNYSLGGTSGDFLGHSRECMKVVHERFPYLTEQEVRGLYHCYFIFSNPQHKIDQDIPESYTGFLRKIMADHANRIDFCSSLGWAAITKLDHPSDRSSPILSRGFVGLKYAIAAKLRRYPFIYNIARNVYRNFIKV
ncbi:glycosyltransferase [Stutzerimonas zhaodongensis]|uniref:Glycosyltransferase n=1 Tax=Stutzerimonas zhaodongensis TaxID=1176257 RepID=A0A3M2I286_9GAMM|nr:glycosyltransferase family 2 protein [Stutzerimonas zhaodongensis]MCQ4314773.1 glycosyltransferase [Stutzerimonas zhaodongensis]RMH92274.1 glycosyltransferase [Stutzerimonas zhaodongensis]